MLYGVGSLLSRAMCPGKDECIKLTFEPESFDVTFGI